MSGDHFPGRELVKKIDIFRMEYMKQNKTEVSKTAPKHYFYKTTTSFKLPQSGSKGKM